MLKIETRIDPIEVQGKQVEGLPKDADQVIVSAHWNVNRWAVIEFHGRSLTVSISELQQALKNAGNHD